MIRLRVILLMASCALLIVSPAFAVTLTESTPLVLGNTNGELAASVTFSLSGGNLIVVLTNTSLADVRNPSQVLTAVFFNIEGNVSLTPVSAVLSGGSTVFFGSNGGGNVGGEWAYANSLSGAPSGINQGISSAGFNLFGTSNFPGSNLNPPPSSPVVNGLDYGITSAGDDPLTGNAFVTGGTPLIQNQVTFTLAGAGSSLDITGAVYQYGTDLSGPSFKASEPITLLLLGSGLLGMAALRSIQGRKSRKNF